MIEIDGSEGEGGGQMLRSALSLSMCTGQPVRVVNIRAKRSRPGLMRQHLACVLAARDVCDAEVTGAEPGSREVGFVPGAVRGGEYHFAIGTAGSCMLLLQTVLPPLLLAREPSRLLLAGGTHNPLAPPFPFIERAFLPLLERMGARVEAKLHRHGFFPAGGGQVEVEVWPAAAGADGRPALLPFDLTERGEPREAWGEALVAAVPRHVAERELAVLATAFGWREAQLRIPPLRANEGPGNAVVASFSCGQVCEVFAAFGEKAVTAETVARRVVNEARGWLESGAAVGPHLADQLLLPLALAVVHSGRATRFTCSSVTEHLRSNAAVIARFLPIDCRIEAQGAAQLVSLLPG
ncbi:RNA 3'-terminal phosphate cyclase [Derxia gummosa]|uniref:RNA 3'-terminal phosphate cyclase n=1 Tax=Derxia gummosa DSM 723 TaxID=1121388 RepID=A0A8B6X584_9BURK|nr:RNA 3'-terminal phosphate cyclase [Derxia gummosa]